MTSKAVSKKICRCLDKVLRNCSGYSLLCIIVTLPRRLLKLLTSMLFEFLILFEIEYFQFENEYTGTDYVDEWLLLHPRALVILSYLISTVIIHNIIRLCEQSYCSSTIQQQMYDTERR